jgi:hypothetical protein
MQNMTNQDWFDVHYVADPETTITNFDGFIGNEGLGDAEEAFRIDSVGINRPLIYESLNQDNIFQAGEVWEFILQDYNLLILPYYFNSIGIASLSSGNNFDSTGSLIASSVPIPDIPIPDIKANGSDYFTTINTDENLLVTIELDCVDQCGVDADWWLLADCEIYGAHYWYYWHLSGVWYSGTVRSYEGPLADVTPPYEVLNFTGLTPGTYTFYFGVDTNMNGVIDLGDLIYDYVTVTVE